MLCGNRLKSPQGNVLESLLYSLRHHDGGVRVPQMTDITGLLSAVKRGDTGAESQLFSLLYGDLRHLAHQRLRRSNPCTLLETTALVHEAYLRLHRAGYIQIADRSHFLAYAARVMRSIMVDFVRKRGKARRADFDASALPDPAGENQRDAEQTAVRLRQNHVPVLLLPADVGS